MIRGSYNQVNYALRPSKQLERKIITTILQQIAMNGVPVSNSTYIGLGSIYYADFILFHKFLHIEKMICAEYKPIYNRMSINKPYEFIDLRPHDIADVVPIIDQEPDNYIIWLDYDDPLHKEHLNSLSDIINMCKKTSIIFITINVERKSYMPRDFDGKVTKKNLKDQLMSYFGDFIGDPNENELSEKKFPKFLAKILYTHIQSNILSKKQWSFFQLFNFLYQDGATMLTFGGILYDSEFDSSFFSSIDFVNDSFQPINLTVPFLTRQERQLIDSKISTISENINHDNEFNEFEIPLKNIKNYIQFYKHYPNYVETLW